jgi:hypothetical protein
MEDEARSHAQILGKKKIKELLQQVDPSERVEPEVEQVNLIRPVGLISRFYWKWLMNSSIMLPGLDVN